MADVPVPHEYRESIIQHLVFTHESITKASVRYAEELRRHYYVTPKNYLDFLSTYRNQLMSNEKHIMHSKKRLEGGLQKLIEASAAVDRMKIDLVEKKTIVDNKTIEVQDLIATIQDKSAIASSQQEQASQKQKFAEEQAIIIDKQKREADDALVEALPAVEAAGRALENLDKNDLTELKAFAQPPLPVKTLCRQLVFLRPTGEKLEDTWEDARKMLGNSNLLSSLKNYPKDDVSEKQVVKVKRLFTENGGIEASLKKMESASNAGFGLLTWVAAIVKYYDIAKNVEPLRNKVITYFKWFL
jgi:dynein heavy chain